jgi:glucose-1-phosphate adenylyltransferase
VGIGDASHPNELFPEHLFSGLTVIGKKAMVPDNKKIYTNSIIEPLVNKESYLGIKLGEGAYVKR